jgi:phospholipid/cholesterol/gamma-HCH transport system substrate-binding protein
MSAGARALAGALVTVLVLNLGYLGARYALGEFAASYPINVVLGEIGQNITSGSEVKVRGVTVGKVGAVTLDSDLNAIAELVMEPQYKIPERSAFAVTGKTLLGEKQIDVIFDGALSQGPFLAAGDTINDAGRVVEFQDVLAELDRLFRAIPPEDLAVVIEDGIGAFDGQGPQIARAIDQGSRATDLGVRILDDQIPATRDLSLVADALSDKGDEFNALAAEAIRGLPTISDNQEGLGDALDALERFSKVVDVTLTVTRPDFDRLVINGDSVTRMMFAYTGEIGEVIYGLNSYTGQYAGGGYMDETIQGQAAPFQLLFDFGISDGICPELPDLPDIPAPPKVPLAKVQAPGDITEPDQSRRLDAVDLLQRAVGRGSELEALDG